MRREDYERMEPKKTIAGLPNEELGYEGVLRCVAQLVENEEGTGFVLVIDVKSVDVPVMIPVRTKHDADETIRCLIAARNKTWPTP